MVDLIAVDKGKTLSRTKGGVTARLFKSPFWTEKEHLYHILYNKGWVIVGYRDKLSASMAEELWEE